jgi:acetyltransferase-like isoleucine patch superfamily enzyme
MESGMPEFLFVPYLGTAEKEVILVDWLVPEGSSFAKGQPLCVIETLKASFEIEAEKAGSLFKFLVGEGERLFLQSPLAVLGEENEVFSEASLAELRASLPKKTSKEGVGLETKEASRGTSIPEREKNSSEKERVQAAPAARKKARALGLDLSSIRGTGPSGLIRLEDVLAASSSESKAHVPSEKGEGMLDPSFLKFLQEEGDSFCLLSSEFRLALYRKYGAKIGPSAFLGEGALILADRLVLGRGFHLGAGGRIESKDFVCGDLVQFGPRLQLRCRKVRIGANAYFAPDVEIGGGGAMDPEAELLIGSHGFVGEHVHLNPCRTLSIGNEVVVSRQASLMTHSFGLDVLEGYPNRFAGVTIEDCCQIGISCTLFPGVRMGMGSILLSGSSLVTEVPEGRLFGGVPAKDMKAARRALGSQEKIHLSRELVQEFGRQLSLRGFDCSEEGKGLVCHEEGRKHCLIFSEALPKIPEESIHGASEWILVSMDVAEEIWKSLPPEGILVDLGKKRIKGVLGPMATSFREFLRKRGVRLEPRTWTYEGGWL